MVIGEVVIYAVGVPWLAVAAHFSPELAIQKGLLPFVLGDALKLAIAAVLFPSAWWLVGRPPTTASRLAGGPVLRCRLRSSLTHLWVRSLRSSAPPRPERPARRGLARGRSSPSLSPAVLAHAPLGALAPVLGSASA